MNRARRFSLLVVGIVCVALALVCSKRAAWAEPQETVSLTFALRIPGNPAFDPLLEPSQYVGEDTVVILFGKFLGADGSLSMTFVGGTEWTAVQLAPATIVNKGGRPIDAMVFAVDPHSAPPPRSVLHAHNITTVDACYYKYCNPLYDTQNAWDDDTSGVFIIVTGEFRVNN